MQVPAFARDRVLELLQASPNLSGSSVRVIMSSEQHCPDIEKLSNVIKVCSALLPSGYCARYAGNTAA